MAEADQYSYCTGIQITAGFQTQGQFNTHFSGIINSAVFMSSLTLQPALFRYD